MRHVPHVLLSLSLLAAGCRNPEDPVFIYGRAAKADGSPLAALSLTLERGPALGWSDEPEDAPPREYLPYASASTEADGDFTLEALAGDLQEYDESNLLRHPLRVVLPPQEGEGTFITFDNAMTSVGDVELPLLQPWDARLALDEGPEGPRLRFAAPPVLETPPSAGLVSFSRYDEDGLYQGEVPITPSRPDTILQLHSGTERLWRQDGVRDTWTPGPYVLEDFASPRAQLRALSLGHWLFMPLASVGGDLTFRQEWRTAPLPLPAGTLRPLSRGATCVPSPPGACPWTDGQLARVPLPRDEDGALPDTLTVTLDAPVRPRRAVLRGLEYGFISLDPQTLLVEGSPDGTTWTLLAEHRLENALAPEQETLRYTYQSLEGPLVSPNPYGDPPLDLFGQEPLFADLPLGDTAPVRQVRVRVRFDENGRSSFLTALSELSLFAAE